MYNGQMTCHLLIHPSDLSCRVITL